MDEGINVSGQPRNEDHFDVSSRLQTPCLISDREQQNQIFPVDQMREMPATSSSQMHDFEVSPTSSNTTELDDLLPSTYVQKNKISPVNCDSPCYTQGFPCHPTSDELKKTSLKLRTDGQFRQCQFSVFSKFSWVTYCLTRGTIACFHCKKAMERNLTLLVIIPRKHFLQESFATGKSAMKSWKNIKILIAIKKLLKNLHTLFMRRMILVLNLTTSTVVNKIFTDDFSLSSLAV